MWDNKVLESLLRSFIPFPYKSWAVTGTGITTLFSVSSLRKWSSWWDVLSVQDVMKSIKQTKTNLICRNTNIYHFSSSFIDIQMFDVLNMKWYTINNSFVAVNWGEEKRTPYYCRRQSSIDVPWIWRHFLSFYNKHIRPHYSSHVPASQAHSPSGVLSQVARWIRSSFSLNCFCLK